jgi:hypothetical protein
MFSAAKFHGHVCDVTRSHAAAGFRGPHSHGKTTCDHNTNRHPTAIMPPRHPALRPLLRPRVAQPPCRRNFLNFRKKDDPGPLDSLNVERFSRQRQQYNVHRLAFLAGGTVAGAVGSVLISIELYKAIRLRNEQKQQTGDQHHDAKSAKIRLDGPDGLTTGEDGVRRKVVVRDELGREVVPTGNTTIETFPRTVELSPPPPPQRNPTSTDTITTAPQNASTEYTLVGLGLRTVTMFGIQVYLVGMYVATADVARLQAHLIKSVNPIATTLVPSERDSLRATLLDHTKGEEEWDALLREAGCRTLFRIVPVRDASLAHMRDALVTAATSRGTQRGYTDQGFGNAIGEFKHFFGRGNAAKGKEVLLCREDNGALVVYFGDGRTRGRQELGRVADERFSRMLWLNYLGGKKVASEQARANIVEGIMEFVERPVGTVATQVV